MKTINFSTIVASLILVAAFSIASDLQAQEDAYGNFADASTAYTLAVHPVYPPHQAAEVFGPLRDFLADHCKCKLELKTFRDFHAYRRDMGKETETGFVLEESHLAAVRIERYGYRPIARENREGRYHLVSAEGGDIRSIADLVARPVATMAAPSLGYLLLDQWFPDSIQQPVIKTDARSWQDAVEMIFSGEAVAANVPDTIASKYPNLRTLRRSGPIASISILAHPDMPFEIVEQVQSALLQLSDDPDGFRALHELNLAGFQATTPLDYAAGVGSYPVVRGR
ncbi:MAG: PhnD/SsuA/transferrin family substrate-binding protein [Wenzhouxiangella sp.]|nr:PhnD/SsuA/transferrin family substrate-binding protein [Wenzhouxiangella sp.]MCH8478416.1 phosphate/phosphite/phosphonate ABC transporter substrate-binding protein [Wenzhouxiangella sp.]